MRGLSHDEQVVLAHFESDCQLFGTLGGPEGGRG